MNLALFEAHEFAATLPRADRRVRHALEVLRRGVGGAFDAGVVNGPRGKAIITALAGDAVSLRFVPETPPPVVPPIVLIVGMCRPQTARDVLRDATTLGIGALHVVATEKAEPSYSQSTLWSSGEWRRHVLAGAEQAFETQVPEVTHGRALVDVLAMVAPVAKTGAAGAVRIALDNYEATTALSQISLSGSPGVALAVGSERGWSPVERNVLRAHGFTLADLGTRVLRTETAVVAGVSLVRANLGLNRNTLGVPAGGAQAT